MVAALNTSPLPLLWASLCAKPCAEHMTNLISLVLIATLTGRYSPHFTNTLRQERLNVLSLGPTASKSQKGVLNTSGIWLLSFDGDDEKTIMVDNTSIYIYVRDTERQRRWQRQRDEESVWACSRARASVNTQSSWQSCEEGALVICIL